MAGGQMSTLPTPIRAAAASAAADVREALTAALHGQPLPDGIACRLPVSLREQATPAACHLLTGRKSVIDAVIGAVIEHHHEAAAADLLAMCRGEVPPAPAGAYPVEAGDPLVDLSNGQS